MQRVTLEAGVRPRLVARPEEVFERQPVEQGLSAPPAILSSTPVGSRSERFSTGGQKDAIVHPSPWSAAEALVQLKVALGDTPVLRSFPLSKAATPAPGALSSPLVANTFLPPVVQYSPSTNGAATSSSTLYAQAALAQLETACQRLMEQLEGGCVHTLTVEESADLPWAQVMASLNAPAVVGQLLRRAEAAVWERECAYRIHDLLVAELRRRGLPVELAKEDVAPFVQTVHDSSALLDDYVAKQHSLDVVAPLLEAAAARAACVRDVAALSSPAATASLEQLKASMSEFAEQVNGDVRVLRKNVEAIQRRVDALRVAAAASPQ